MGNKHHYAIPKVKASTSLPGNFYGYIIYNDICYRIIKSQEICIVSRDIPEQFLKNNPNTSKATEVLHNTCNIIQASIGRAKRDNNDLVLRVKIHTNEKETTTIGELETYGIFEKINEAATILSNEPAANKGNILNLDHNYDYRCYTLNNSDHLPLRKFPDRFDISIDNKIYNVKTSWVLGEEIVDISRKAIGNNLHTDTDPFKARIILDKKADTELKAFSWRSDFIKKGGVGFSGTKQQLEELTIEDIKNENVFNAIDEAMELIAKDTTQYITEKEVIEFHNNPTFI